MTHNSPKLLIIILLLLHSVLLNAQMDFETANIIMAYEEEKAATYGESENESLIFNETGKGHLTNGIAEIKIDPDIARKIHGKKIDDLVTVSIQMEGKSNGVYISKKNIDTFVITELNSGTSNSQFSYRFTVSSPN